jgi:hypothetical protein
MRNESHPATQDILAERLDCLVIGDSLSLSANEFKSLFGGCARKEIEAASNFAQRHGCRLDYSEAECESAAPAIFTRRSN